jgi:hypothetical protein
MEQNKEMTAAQSLAIITETLNNSRKDILRSSAKYYILWGVLLTFFSLLIYVLWKTSGNAAWNNLWFAMPAMGFPLAKWLERKEGSVRTENAISRISGGIWLTFGIFACSVAVFHLLFSLMNTNPIGAVAVGTSLSAQIILLFGMAEAISGVALKNLAIKIAGFLTGIGGLALYYGIGLGKEQMFLFTFAGIVLAATGLIVKHQYK